MPEPEVEKEAPDEVPNEVPNEVPKEPEKEVRIDREATEIDVKELQLAESVGTGGTAEVFRGSYKAHPVAIKQLFRHRKMDDKEKISFDREVTVLAAITHPNLVKFFGVAFKDKPFRIVTEFCHGGTCFDLIHNSSFLLSWCQKMKICIDTACGMHYLHAFKPQIIHRDLKSLNLLLEKHVKSPKHIPTVKVSDFGLSRMKEPGLAWGKMTAQVGTLHWMAPEVFAGSNYDESCDVYSYAMVMYEAVCQEVPFEDIDPGLIGAKTVRGVRPNLCRAPKGFPGKLRELMCNCWAQDPAGRPCFLEALQALIEIDKENTGGAATKAAPAAVAAAASAVPAKKDEVRPSLLPTKLEPIDEAESGGAPQSSASGELAAPRSSASGDAVALLRSNVSL